MPNHLMTGYEIPLGWDFYIKESYVIDWAVAKEYNSDMSVWCSGIAPLAHEIMCGNNLTTGSTIRAEAG